MGGQRGNGRGKTPFFRMLRHQEGFNSLRGRYLVVAALLTTLVLATVWSAEHFVTRTQDARRTSLQLRSNLAHHNRLLRNAVFHLEKALESFLWAPTQERRQRVQVALQNALKEAHRLAGLPWPVDTPHEPLAGIVQELEQLRPQLGYLMNVRSHKALQYPAIAIISRTMYPAHDRFATAIQTALAELNTPPQPGGNATLRQQFDQVERRWLRLVALFRLYVANRSGTFAGQNLAGQRQDIDAQAQALHASLTTLAREDAQGQLPLQTSDALATMRGALRAWMAGYAQVKQVDTQQHWRADLSYLSTTLHPGFEQLWHHLQELENQIEGLAMEDIHTLNGTADTLIDTLWGLALLALLFIALGFALFERTVLHPIAQITRAMRGSAYGMDVVLPKHNILETDQLAEAFLEMQKQVEERQQALEHQALHDALTGLPNRILLQDRLQQSLYQAQRNHTVVSLLLMDLDGFKEINDTLGHHVGDQLLQKLGGRLATLLRQSDTVARLGGDEFCLLLPDIDTEQARQVADKVIAVMESPFLIEDHTLYITGSIGIAVYPLHATDADTLNRKADVAMYAAKRDRLGIVSYDPNQDRDNLRRLSLANDLRNMLNQDTLELYYQPQLDLRSNEVTKLEALLRWHHPTRGDIPPDEFIPVAEQAGLIHQITYWVLEQALRQLSHWRGKGFTFKGVAVNLSAQNLQDPALLPRLREMLARWHIEPGELSLELTESAMMYDPLQARRVLGELDNLGIQIAVDDFGTGFSSLAYLKQLPVSTLKIDKSFVFDMSHDDNDAAIVHSTIELAHNLGLEVVAEGVETQETLERLNALGCDLVQGFFVARPCPVQELERWTGESPCGHYHWSVAT